MSFIKSLVFGSEGSYNVLGVPVTFQEKHLEDKNDSKALSKSEILVVDLITHVVCHTFFHEMGHAFACKIVGVVDPKVYIYSDGTGHTSRRFNPNDLRTTPGRWGNVVICLAGPMSEVAFASVKLVVANAFKSYISWPGVALLGIGSAIAIGRQIGYAIRSALAMNNGDFGLIAQQGKAPLAVASIALASEIALGVFAAVMLAKSIL